jgi:hypothetical protein
MSESNIVPPDREIPGGLYGCSSTWGYRKKGAVRVGGGT